MAQLVKNTPANAGDARDVGSIPGSGRPLPGVGNGSVGNGSLLQYYCLGYSTDRILAGYSSWGHKESDVTSTQAQSYTQRTV